MRSRPAITVLGTLACALALAGSTGAATSPNLLANPGAEAGAGSSDGGVVKIPGWTVTGTFTAVRWDASCPGGCPTKSDYPRGGTNMFAGGNSASSRALQEVSVARFAAAIDRGAQRITLGAALGGWEGQHDAATVQASFLDRAGKPLGSASVGGDTYGARKGATAFVTLSRTAVLPKGTRAIRVTLLARRTDGQYDDAYFDDLVLRLIGA